MRYYANTARVGSDLSRVPGLFLSLEYTRGRAEREAIAEEAVG